MSTEETGTLQRKHFTSQAGEPLPGLLVAYAPTGSNAPAQCAVDDEAKILVGRAEGCNLRIPETSVSRLHFVLKVNPDDRKASLADGGGKNGTYVDGRRIEGIIELEDGAVIRAGRVLLVYCADVRPMFRQRVPGHDGLVGRFHARALLGRLEEAASSGRNALLSGPSGSGKELAAQALATMADRKLITQNAARFSSQEEATTSLFGVTQGAFTNVKDRPGYIERANGGVLFLDEAHVLPERVQKSLLRVLEDGVLARFGQTGEREVDVRFVLATNEPPPDHGLVHDLLNRLMVVEIPPLNERVADIPSIFDHLVAQAFDKAGVELPPINEILSDEHYESLMLDGFERDNVRGLADIASRIAARVSTGSEVGEAVGLEFARRYRAAPPCSSSPLLPPPKLGGPVGQTAEIPHPVAYKTEAHRHVHVAFARVGGNVTAIDKELRAQGIRYSRRRITKLVDQLGLPRVRRG